MALKPSEWSVVVIASWNRAILTPAGIAKRVFGFPEKTAIDVLVPIDAIGIAPTVVVHDNIQVLVSDDRLTIKPLVADFDTLQRAKKLACSTLENLKQTPYLAAGINIGYETSETPASIQELVTQDFDTLLDEKYPITQRTYLRSVGFEEGGINFTVSRNKDSEYRIQINFELKSSSNSELLEWLGLPIEKIEEASNVFVKELLHLDIEKEHNDDS